ncbi:hypothetical protein [Ancylobacter polymorphus]|uniref:Uncharacterized protein n=1 Tax=Ancylobacter polymorphus TaxID=223390 RepID=A0ABU0BHC6_9HYPH|nr:hypothetical protein [Ancylobacter polymorphus]MDQ0304840.1 hypothetical protein [Ancylobacter polymorphus]
MAALPAGLDEGALAEELTQAFPGFSFSAASIDDPYWRDTRSVLAPDGTRIARAPTVDDGADGAGVEAPSSECRAVRRAPVG